MKVLLVGGNGFMGRAAARALLQAGHDVAVLARGTRPAPDGVEVVAADRDDPAALAAALGGRRFDVTVDWIAYDGVDVERLFAATDAAALGRYVLISTGQVYVVTRSERTPFREEESLAPLLPEPPRGTSHYDSWAYGIGKRRAEEATLALRGHGVRPVIVRLPIVQGEEDGTLRLAAWLERMQDGGPVLLPNGGRRPVRFIDREDVARVVVALAEREPREVVYNFAQPDVLELREFLERTARAAGLTPRFVAVPGEELEAANLPVSSFPYAGPWVSVLDPTRSATELGFAGTLTDGYLPRVVRWHLEHPPAERHPGLAGRDREIAYAARLAGAS